MWSVVGILAHRRACRVRTKPARMLVRHAIGAYREGQRTSLPWEKEDIREDDVNTALKSGATFGICEMFPGATSI